jgi:hypothetical protein
MWNSRNQERIPWRAAWAFQPAGQGTDLTSDPWFGCSFTALRLLRPPAWFNVRVAN